MTRLQTHPVAAMAPPYRGDSGDVPGLSAVSGADPQVAAMQGLLGRLRRRPTPDELTAATNRPLDAETIAMLQGGYQAQQPVNFDDEITADLNRWAAQARSSQAGVPANRMDAERGRQAGVNDFLLESMDPHSERLRESLGIEMPTDAPKLGPIETWIGSTGGGHAEAVQAGGMMAPGWTPARIDQARREALARQAEMFRQQAQQRRESPTSAQQARDADLAQRHANVRHRGILGRDRYMAMKESEAMAQMLGGMAGNDSMNPVMLAAMGVQPGVIDAILESQWRAQQLVAYQAVEQAKAEAVEAANQVKRLEAEERRQAAEAKQRRGY